MSTSSNFPLTALDQEHSKMTLFAKKLFSGSCARSPYAGLAQSEFLTIFALPLVNICWTLTQDVANRPSQMAEHGSPLLMWSSVDLPAYTFRQHARFSKAPTASQSYKEHPDRTRSKAHDNYNVHAQAHHPSTEGIRDLFVMGSETAIPGQFPEEMSDIFRVMGCFWGCGCPKCS